MTIDVPGTDRLLAAAGQIATSLCDAAIWSADRRSCTWQGPSAIYAGETITLKYVQMADIGASLYGGTAGVALFLGEIAALTGNGRFAETAAAAGRHVGATPVAHPSLYSGSTGMALVLLRLAECLQDSNLQRNAQHLLMPAIRAGQQPDGVEKSDVIAGLAGIIQGLVAVHRRQPDPALLTAATALGRALCERADWTDDYCCWAPDGPESLMDKPLVGISHGSSGIGAALLALFAQTGEEDFLVTGRGAFAFDDAIFDAEGLAWPDQRRDAIRLKGGAESWCYGSPGIMMARLLAADSDPDQREQHRYYAGLAAEITLRSLRQHWMAGRQESCICHGSIGACEALAAAGHHGLGADFRTEGMKAALELIRRRDADEDWPFLIRSSIGLMTGQAGVGHALLRVAHPDRVESALMIR